MSIKSKFIEILQAGLSPTLTQEQLLNIDVVQYRIDGYNNVLTMLKGMAADAPYLELSTELQYDKTKTTPVTQIAYTLREAIDDYMLAVKRGDKVHAQIAANIFNLAALELNESFKLLGLEGTQLSFHFTDDDVDALRLDLPPELVAQLTDAEKLILPPGYNMDDCPTEEQLPFCPVKPCLGCDVRRKILAFRALVEAGSNTPTRH